MARNFQKEIPQLTEDHLTNADNANHPHNVLQKNILYLYNTLLSQESQFTTSPSNIYVDGVTGKDSNGGTSESPFRTLGRAAEEITQIAVNTQTIVHVKGYGTTHEYSPSSFLSLDLPDAVSTQQALSGVVFKATSDKVVVNGGQTTSHLMKIEGGYVFFSGQWEMKSFSRSALYVEGGIGIRSGASVTLSNNGKAGVVIDKGGVALVDRATLTGSGNWQSTDIHIKNGSILHCSGNSELGGVTAEGNASFLWQEGSGSITADAGKSAAVDISQNSYAILTGQGANTSISVRHESGYTKPSVQATHNASIELGYLNLPATDSGYGIRCVNSSSLNFDSPVSWSRGKNGVLVDCSSAWSGGSSLGEISTNNGNTILHSDFSCANDSSTSFTITAKSGANGSISPEGEISAAENSTPTFTLYPDDGYETDTLTLENTDITDFLDESGSFPTYTFSEVSSNQTITSTFKTKEGYAYEYITFDQSNGSGITQNGTSISPVQSSLFPDTDAIIGNSSSFNIIAYAGQSKTRDWCEISYTPDKNTRLEGRFYIPFRATGETSLGVVVRKKIVGGSYSVLSKSLIDNYQVTAVEDGGSDAGFAPIFWLDESITKGEQITYKITFCSVETSNYNLKVSIVPGAYSNPTEGQMGKCKLYLKEI